MKDDEYDKYVAFFKGWGDVLKEGVGRDWTNREKVADLLLFESLKTEAGKYRLWRSTSRPCRRGRRTFTI